MHVRLRMSVVKCRPAKYFFLFNRLIAIWPKAHQRGSLGEESPERRLPKNKQCEKVVFPQESNLQPLDYRSTALSIPSLVQVVEQWTGNPGCRFDSCGKTTFSHCLFLGSRRSGDSSPRLPRWWALGQIARKR